MKVSSVSQMRAMDARAMAQFRIPEPILMENAGLAATRVLRAQWPEAGMRWLVLCGVGNNGGDGLVVARHFHSRGIPVRVVILGDPARYGEAAAANLAMVEAIGLPLSRTDDLAVVRAELAACDGIVDALLGTGITRPVRDLYAAVIETVNAAGKPVLSLDVPSGVNGDTGQVMGVAVRAGHTVTFGLPKPGNLLYPGAELGGRLWVTHIGFPSALTTDPALTIAANDPLPLPPRPVDGHKGTFGDTLFIAGAGAYFGAPYFASLGYMKAGGGYARLATPRSVAAVVATRAPELVFMPQPETATGAIALAARAGLQAAAADVDFVVMGPGTSLDAETQVLLRDLTAAVEKPLLIDGDGLTALAADLEIIRQRTHPTVLTPHLGELARLTGLTVTEIRADRITVLRELSQGLGAHVVMKGAHSLVGLPDGRIFINLSGNAGMATAGSGDVLSGAIAAMAGLGLPIDDAVRMGVFVHGVAGDMAAEEVGEDGMTAQDILAALPAAVAASRARSQAWLDRYTPATV